MLNVSTNLKFPMRLVMLIGDGSEKELKKHLQKEIQFEEPEETLMDKSAKWLQEKVPLETEN